MTRWINSTEKHTREREGERQGREIMNGREGKCLGKGRNEGKEGWRRRERRRKQRIIDIKLSLLNSNPWRNV